MKETRENLRTDGRADGQTEGRTDGLYFIGPFRPRQGVQKTFNSVFRTIKDHLSLSICHTPKRPKTAF